MTIAIGADEAALDLKNLIKDHLVGLGLAVTDFGVFDSRAVDYPDIAIQVAESIRLHRHDRGLLFCGTGLGMAIAANKVPGIRAATCHDSYSAERARKSNDAQILTMGSRVIGPELAKTVIDAWLRSEFQGGGSTKKVALIEAIEHRYSVNPDSLGREGRP